jgi:peptidoglycan/xylan/chitin deacetylase (PgdA/CDA1 family)
MSAIQRMISSPAGLRLALEARDMLQRADQAAARVAPKDRPGLLVLVFHCLFESPSEAENEFMDPHERATPDRLTRLFEYLRHHGYRFVSGQEIAEGLAPAGLYVHLTFDDGFANNLRLVDLLAREQVHTTIFPSANNIRTGSAFWWNVIYRERRGRGRGALAAEYATLRNWPSERVNRYLLEEFGAAGLRPGSDLDRPLTVAELRDLAASPWIGIGNHTLDHAILTACAAADAEAQIDGAQQWLQDELGAAPTFIAYPDGAVSAEVVALARRAGLMLGATVKPKRNELPLSETDQMLLSRQRIVFDQHEPARMRTLRSSLQLADAARGLVVRRG